VGFGAFFLVFGLTTFGVAACINAVFDRKGNL
jgi:hypothetical protein